MTWNVPKHDCWQVRENIKGVEPRYCPICASYYRPNCQMNEFDTLLADVAQVITDRLELKRKRGE